MSPPCTLQRRPSCANRDARVSSPLGNNSHRSRGTLIKLARITSSCCIKLCLIVMTSASYACRSHTVTPVKMMVVNFPCLLRRSRMRAAPALSLQAPLILQRLTVGVRNACMYRPLHSIALATTRYGAFPAAVVVHARHRATVRWQGACNVAAAILVYDLLILSLYLPQPGRGLPIFLGAISEVKTLIASVPKRFAFKVPIGCDANATLARNSFLPDRVGPCAPPPPADERGLALLGLMLSVGAYAPSTYGNRLEDYWTHEWYGDRSVRSQLDYVFVPLDFSSVCSVNYGLDCRSDHKALVCSVHRPLPAPSHSQRRRNRRGSVPVDVGGFCDSARSLPTGSSVNDIQAHLAAAVVWPSTQNGGLGSCGNRYPEPDHVCDARLRLAESISADDRNRWGKAPYRRKRKWVRWLSERRFIDNALSLPRPDRVNANRVAWLADPLGLGPMMSQAGVLKSCSRSFRICTTRAPRF